ncbi:RabGAP/TBC [Neoconidiobolus thromboides FSU 785]|nr:RabGAP/TBC [Neoconidiobolus thromboides FSU 785]
MVEDPANNEQFGSFYYPNIPLNKEDKDSNYDKYGFEKSKDKSEVEIIDQFNIEYQKKLIFREKQWNSMLLQNANLPLDRNSKVKRYIRKGIPTEWRAKMWFYYSGAEEKWLKNQGLYKHLLSKVINQPDFLSFSREIDQDLHRTFPNNKHFKTKPNGNYTIGFDPKSNALLSALRRVLLCYTYYKKENGYQQSFSYIVGQLLLFMDEEKSFFTLITITDNIMNPQVYIKGGKGSTIMVRTFLALMRSKFNKLWNFILEKEKNGMPSLALAISHWFPLLYCDLLPIESNLRVWDCLFYEGEKILYRIGLALFKIYQLELMNSNLDPLQLFQQIQNLPKKLYNAHILMEIAFSNECSFSSNELIKFQKLLDFI